MTLNIISSGIDTGFSTKLNDNFLSIGAESVRNALNHRINSTDTFSYPDLFYQYDDQSVDHTNTTAYARADSNYIVFIPYVDRMDDASISSTYWTTSTSGTSSVVEAGTDEDGGITLTSTGASATATLKSNGSTGIDLQAADCEVVFYTEFSGPTSGTIFCEIVGSSSGSATLFSQSGAGSGDTGLYHLVVSVSGTECKVYKDLTLVDTVDLSSLTGSSWYLQFRNNVGSGTGTIKVFGIGMVSQGDSTTETVYYSGTNSLSSNLTGAIAVSEYGVSSSAPKISVSANGGSGYATDVEGEEALFHSLTSSGSGVLRLKDTSVTGITAAYPNISSPTIKYWGIKHD